MIPWSPHAASTLLQESDSDRKTIRIHRLEVAPTIDGYIGPDEWANAARVHDLHEVEPVEFTAPSERTVWYVAASDSALYIAAYAYNSQPGEIVARVLRQGASLDDDDSMSIIVDPFNNKRSGYSFTLNPNGVRAEAIYTSPTRYSDDWNGVWRGAAKIVDDGWTMEMALPFSTVTFDPENDTWGINFSRRIARHAEQIAWQSRNGQINPAVSGQAYGLEGLNQGLGLDVIPSASVNYFTSPEHNATESQEVNLNASIDLSYKLTPALNALITINTDFAATEVDGRRLALDRFDLFFPEKRSFFLADFDIFQFGAVPTGNDDGDRTPGLLSGHNGLAFFSRRIGLTGDSEPVDIVAGTKISGRIANFDIGSLYILQDGYVNRSSDRIDQSDLFVTRISSGVLEESTAGLIVTSGDPESNTNGSLVGADFLYRNTRLGTNRSVEGNFWIQKSNNADIGSQDTAWSANIGFPASVGFSGGIQIQEVEENFRPALGFANRTGVRLYAAETEYKNVLSNRGAVRELEHSLEYTQWRYLDSDSIQSEKMELKPLEIRTVDDDRASLDISLHKERLLSGEQPLEAIGILLAPGEYSFDRFEALMRSARHRPLAFELQIDDGEWFSGDRFRIRPQLQWRPNKRFAAELTYDYNKYEFPEQSAVTKQITLENEVALNANWSTVMLAEYDNVSDSIGINARLHHNMAAGRDIWFVVNHNMVRDAAIGDRFRSSESMAVAKIQYTLRF